MTKRGQVVKKKKDHLSYLKQLTKWFCSPGRRISIIENLTNYYEVENYKLFLRVISYCYSNLHIVWFFNKYINSLFDFYKFKNTDLANSMAYVMDSNGHSRTNKFFYLKGNDQRDNYKFRVKKIISNYFRTIYQRPLNDTELNFQYTLFQKNLITTDEIIEMDIAVNGEKSKINFEDLEQSRIEQSRNIEIVDSTEQIKEYINKCRIEPLPEKISDFCRSLKDEKLKREECQICKLKDKPMVILDTNMNDFGVVDIAFIALNPGKDEVTYDKPLVGAAGKHHRKKMFYMPPNTKWLLSNVILCNTANQKEIGKNNKEILNVARFCRPNLTKIFEKFPAKLYVPMGGPAAEVFGIKGSIVSNSGKVFDINNVKILPCVHPSAVIQYHGKMEDAYNHAWQTIYSSLGATPNQTQNIQEIHQEDQQLGTNYTVDPSKMITEVRDGLTLFDIVDLDGYKTLMTFLDENGKKFYMIRDNEMPIYIKNSDWKQREMLVDDIDTIVKIQGVNRYKVVSTVRDVMNVTKNTLV